MRSGTPLQRLLSFLPNVLHLDNRTGVAETPRINLVTRGTPLECQRNSTFTQIPEDILFLIADQLDETAKASLIRTCRYFHRLLEVSLYRRITLSLLGRYDRTDRLFRTLEQRQDLLPCIRTYHGPLLPIILEFESLPRKQSFLGMFKKRRRVGSVDYVLRPINETNGFKRAVSIFKKATNIEELDLIDYYGWLEDLSFEPIKTAVSTMSLRKLTLWDGDGLAQVLRDQPELEELSFGWNSHGLEQLEKTDVPKLKALNAPLREAALLVPGRPIERLSLVPGLGHEFDEPLFDKFLLSTTRILEFSIQRYRPWEDERVRAVIRAIARTLPGLERLTLTVKGQISGRAILDEIPSLPSIRCLTFIEARLATAADQAHSAVHDWNQSPHNENTVQQTPAVEEWDDIFDRLRALFTITAATLPLPSKIHHFFLPPPTPSGMAELQKPSVLSQILRLTNQVPNFEIFTKGPPLKLLQHSKLVQVPVEILLLIVDYLDRADLVSLIRTCQHFHHLLEGAIYRDIRLFISWGDKRCEMLFETLVNRPDLILNIRSYHGALLSPTVRHPDTIHETKGFKNALFFFNNATNIVDLNITWGPNWPQDGQVAPIAAAVSRLTLKRLTLWSYFGLASVLRAQPELEELVLRWAGPGLEKLEKTDVPKLRSLSAPLREAAYLVPGRPIERLKLCTSFGSTYFYEGLFDKLSLSTSRISELSVAIYAAYDEEGVRAAIRAIVRNCPEVEKLEIIVGGDISREATLEEIPLLQSLRCLTFLKARPAVLPPLVTTDPPPGPHVDQRDSDPEKWRDLLAELKQSCPWLANVSYTP
ncbi:hypothetical protein FRC05_010197 [Tulasnella sp. 425]|nr:hypothetical protein FRC05_010197 [Tulasnella sp. 425]